MHGMREIGADLAAVIDGVERVHHIHAWPITQERKMITLHVVVAEGTVAEAATAASRARLKARFGLAHATVEVERESCADES